ncbi:MAG TPA: 50S ribosomal protein L35 [Firmicutes bacterium]|jgi:large subunit ribosomal protein L35|uniref:Large ribosomal subunit protein bL35 n=1 Tax=candidate division TA06 bacterium TaxID=2250710 RepID=A0A660S4R4_UNCT6|nr:50S ribosomal protein L35 [candidate division WOR-3 bacterium]RKX64592.1 MAG: 50S ribosomal protein L35 [candidate division TA06 bacterium]HFD05141.1 50S ribosomal protein L35 [Bacillota bacterium]
MPKIKTNRSAAKRIKFNGKGKAIRRKANLRHINSYMTRRRKRRLKVDIVVDKTDQKRIKRMLPYG